MSTGKRLGGKEAAAKGRFLNHLNFGYAKHIKVKEKPSEDAMEQMQRTNISKEVIDRYCNGIEFDCMSCMVHAICMKNLFVWIIYFFMSFRQNCRRCVTNES